MFNVVQSPAVCIALNKMCIRVLRYIPVFDISLLIIQYHVNMAYIELWLIHVFKRDDFFSVSPSSLSEWRKHLSFLFLPFPLCWFLPAWLHTIQVKHKRQVSLWKLSSSPCLINDWHLCQSIHSAATACNKSHLAGRWADPQSSPESLTSDKHDCLADYQTNTWPRSIRQPKLPLNLRLEANETWCKTTTVKYLYLWHVTK